MKSTKINILLLVSLFFLGNSTLAISQELTNEIDKIAEQYNTDEPGVAVLVAKEGKVIYDKGFENGK